MTESSRSRVTISIGCGRQLVRRAGVGLDRSDEPSTPLIGTKRSFRDRLGGDAGSSVLHNGPMNSMRQRGDISFSSRGSNGVSDMHVGRDDLPLKLMRKNASWRSGTDLRVKLDKTAHSSMKVFDTQRHMPDRKDSTYMARIPSSSVSNELPRADPLGTSSYAIEVDMTALKKMGESDLKEIGIPMVPRKKFLSALAPSSKRLQKWVQSPTMIRVKDGSKTLK